MPFAATVLSQTETRRSRRRESGQGIIEYILVLFVTVILVLGGIYQLNTAFAAWAQNYFGEYLSCLLETGELPSLGGSTGAAGICDEQFQPFSIADGRPLIDDGGGGPGGGGGAGGGDGSGRGNVGGSRSTAGGGGSSASGNRIAGGGGSGGGGFGRSGRFRSGRGRSGGGRGGVADGGDDGTYTGSTQAINVPGARGSRQLVRVRKGRGLYGGYSVSRDDEEDRKVPMATVKRGPSSSGPERQEKLKVKRALKKMEPPKDDDGITIGNFFRILIIAAILIALLVFLGGQALQITKSME